MKKVKAVRIGMSQSTADQKSRSYTYINGGK